MMPFNGLFNLLTPVNPEPARADFSAIGQFGQALQQKQRGEAWEKVQQDQMAMRKAEAETEAARYAQGRADRSSALSQKSEMEERDFIDGAMSDIFKHKGADQERKIAEWSARAQQRGFTIVPAEDKPAAPTARATPALDAMQPMAMERSKSDVDAGIRKLIDPRSSSPMDEQRKKGRVVDGKGSPVSPTAAPPAAETMPSTPALDSMQTIQKDKPNSRFRIMKGDRVVADLDLSQTGGATGGTAAQQLRPYVSNNENTPENQRAAKLGFEAAEAAEAAGVPTDEAVKRGIRAYEFERGEAGKNRRVPNGVGGGVPSIGEQPGGGVDFESRPKGDRQGYRDKAAGIESWLRTADRSFGAPAAKKDLAALKSILAKTASPNAYEQRTAIADLLRRNSGATVSQQEREFYMEGSGYWNSLLTKYKSFTDGGEIAPELLKELAVDIANMRDRVHSDLQSKAKLSADSYRRIYNDEEGASIVQDMLTGESSVPQGGSAPGQPVAAGQSGAANVSEARKEELKRKHGL